MSEMFLGCCRLDEWNVFRLFPLDEWNVFRLFRLDEWSVFRIEARPKRVSTTIQDPNKQVRTVKFTDAMHTNELLSERCSSGSRELCTPEAVEALEPLARTCLCVLLLQRLAQVRSRAWTQFLVNTRVSTCVYCVTCITSIPKVNSIFVPRSLVNWKCACSFWAKQFEIYSSYRSD